ncbi:UNVERIFIED_CONTAM: hypothetical protein Sradi_2372200, partial [Sesamum radiatum]
MLSCRKHSICCTVHRPDVAYALSVTSRYKACAGEAHWGAIKSILKYLKRTKDMFFIYDGGELILEVLKVVWWLGRVPSRIPQRIPQRKLNTLQLHKGGGLDEKLHPRVGEMVSRGDCMMDRVSSAEKTADALTMLMSQVAHTQHLDKMGLRAM